MDQNIKKIVTVITLLIIIGVVSGYSYFCARNLLAGPSISLTEPLNGSVFEKSIVVIKGKASNIVSISLNDNKIFVDKEGNFAEPLLLLNGYNVFKISAEDRFGRQVEKRLELVYKEEAPVNTANSTSTAVSINKN